MIINDELLNHYIEGELDVQTVEEIKNQINESEELRIRFNALMKVHNELKKIELKQTSPGFTSAVMAKIVKPVREKKSDRIFILSIAGIFVAGCLSIIGFAVYFSAELLSKSNHGKSLIQYVFSYTENISPLIKNLFNHGSISLIGAVMSLLIIITGYIYFDNRKKFNTSQS